MTTLYHADHRQLHNGMPIALGTRVEQEDRMPTTTTSAPPIAAAVGIASNNLFTAATPTYSIAPYSAFTAANSAGGAMYQGVTGIQQQHDYAATYQQAPHGVCVCVGCEDQWLNCLFCR
jgi:hypothetical protein